MNMKTPRDQYKEAEQKVKEIIVGMNGMSEEDFFNKCHHDFLFKRGVDVLISIFLENEKLRPSDPPFIPPGRVDLSLTHGDFNVILHSLNHKTRDLSNSGVAQKQYEEMYEKLTNERYKE